VKEWAGPLRFLLTIGWYMVVSLLVPTLLGHFWLDPKFDKAPLFTLIGLGIGTVIAFYGLVRMLRRYKAEQNELNKDKR
jgi:F0F1-type ATP synthase assembly protein I